MSGPDAAGSSRPRTRRAWRVASQAAVVGAAMAVGNLLSYLLSVTASRRLGPEQFGILGALLGLLVVGYVAALALQMVTTRREAVAAAGGAAGGGALTRTALLASVSMGLLGLAATAPLVHFLHLPGPVTLLLVAATCIPMTWSGYLTGLVLGRERFARVALTVLLFSVGKVGGGLAGLVWAADVEAVMWGTAIGTYVGVAAATFLVRPFIVAPARLADDRPSREVLHVGHALLALFVFTNADILLARHFLPALDAGLFAAGSIVTKIAFWLPQFVLVVALPRLADRGRRGAALTVALAATGVVGVATTLTAAVAGGLVVALVAGPQYEQLAEFVWLFAAEGSVFALAQLMLYGRLSRQDRTAVLAVWAAVAALVAAVATLGHGSPQAVVTSAVLVGAGLAMAGLVALRLDRTAGGDSTPAAAPRVASAPDLSA